MDARLSFGHGVKKKRCSSEGCTSRQRCRMHNDESNAFTSRLGPKLDKTTATMIPCRTKVESGEIVETNEEVQQQEQLS